MPQEILINVIADLIVTIGLTLLGVSTIVVFYILERQRLLQFFGITNSNPNLSIFVSRLEIKPGGTTGFEPISQGYFGPGIIRVEYKGALLIRDTFRSRLFARLPEGFQGWLAQRSVALVDLDPEIDVSPKNPDEIPNDNLVLLGTGIYNLGSQIYLNHSSSYFEYTKNDKGERIFRIRTKGLEGVEIPGRSIDRELGIIQRINDHNHNRVIFICAGLGASATHGCAKYLIDNWQDLNQKYKHNEFGICLAFSGQTYNSDDVVNPKIVYETLHNYDK